VHPELLQDLQGTPDHNKVVLQIKQRVHTLHFRHQENLFSTEAAPSSQENPAVHEENAPETPERPGCFTCRKREGSPTGAGGGPAGTGHLPPKLSAAAAATTAAVTAAAGPPNGSSTHHEDINCSSGGDSGSHFHPGGAANSSGGNFGNFYGWNNNSLAPNGGQGQQQAVTTRNPTGINRK